MRKILKQIWKHVWGIIDFSSRIVFLLLIITLIGRAMEISAQTPQMPAQPAPVTQCVKNWMADCMKEHRRYECQTMWADTRLYCPMQEGLNP